MALIPNFPQNLLDLHHNWHQTGSHPGPGARVHPFGTTGGGLEFLQFHRDYVAQVLAWYNALPFGTAPYNVAPFQTLASAQAAAASWTSIPAALKNGAVTGWGGVQIAQEARLTTLTPTFASVDDLGEYIEGGIHVFLHNASAVAFNEPTVGTFHSPLSTIFYGIHGLVDLWWRNWAATQRFNKSIRKDFKEIHKEFKEIHKEIIKDQKELIFEKPFEKPFKEKDKDLVEAGGIQQIGDPALLAGAGVAASGGDLERRVRDLEIKVSQQAFITPLERPMLGEAAHAHAAEKTKKR
jgi:hypothetical protein